MRSLVLLLVALPLSAQTTIDIGAAVGQQSYAASTDDSRVLTGADLLARRGNAGLHVAVEYADLTEEGALFVFHPDLVYRRPFGSFALMAGAGPTLMNVGGSGSGLTWNAELELERRFGRVGVFGRVRHYDYGLERDRAGESGPDGPAIYVGVRFQIAGAPGR